ncbi:MAG: hypothetical protein FJ096_09140 [Deltaproteobacteria bacterium]|nr:hypothetical protein [Deltaproteobacteria bacterium]
MADFAFATCQPGFERALKLDVARRRPELRFSYSRPGLVTFKSPRPILPGELPGSVFARVWGASLGAARTPEAARAILASLPLARCHVFARDPEQPSTLGPWSKAVESLAPSNDALPGDLVADVVVADGEPAWLGLHVHRDDDLGSPGGVFEVPIPAEAPSRAFAKLEEALVWSRLPVAEGHVALEVGSAPGGASLALAMRGVTVYGVDPALMDPAVLDYRGPGGARVHHLATKVSALRWESLPGSIDWLLADMNLAPQVVLHELARLMPPLRRSLAGAILTLKLNDWAFIAELPELVRRVESFGFRYVRLRHLPSNRREICLVAAADPPRR